jgi:hypothetical protein
MIFDSEFKEALQLLPSAEKDKLILRLLKHDLNLANKLRFELLDTDTVETKRKLLENRIIKHIELASKHYYSAGYLLMDTRDISGEINEHVSITQDKLGEISLNCTMLRHLLELNNQRIATATQAKAYTLSIYIVARIFKILLLIQKQHEDFQIEFIEDIQKIGILIGKNNYLMKTAILNGLDINWLINFNIPNNIADIYKDLRRKGLLR